MTYFTLNSNRSDYIKPEHKFYIKSNNKNYNPKYNKDSKPPYNYTKVVVENAFHNRKIIASWAKKAVGVYVFTSETGSCYVGSSISLYNRVCSYFMPSILAKGDRRVLRYFHKYRFNNISLTLYIMDPDSTSDMAVELEQYFIDILRPDLNVDYVASSTGYHEPMSMEWRQYLRILRGTPVYVYDISTKSLVHMFDSKTYLEKSLGIDHSDLNEKYLDKNKPYYLRFLFTTLALSEMSVESVMTLDDTIKLFEQTRLDTSRLKLQGNKNKSVRAIHTFNSALSQDFLSLQECSRGLKGDRQTIRNYLNGHSTGLYRKIWKLS